MYKQRFLQRASAPARVTKRVLDLFTLCASRHACGWAVGVEFGETQMKGEIKRTSRAKR